MTPAQRLAQALYGYHDDTAVKAARDYAKRLAEAGLAVVSAEATEAMAKAADKEWPNAFRMYAAAIQAYQQEIEAE